MNGMMQQLHPRMTAARLNYLQAVEKHGVYEPRHGKAANNCLHLGWVESVFRMQDGEIRRWGDFPLDQGERVGQRLTDAGRVALNAARNEAKAPLSG